MIEIDWNPGPRQLRQFAVAAVVGFPLIGYLLTRILPAGVPAAPAVVIGTSAALGVLICLAGLWRPRWVRPVYLALSLVALPIGLALGFLLIPLIYYAVFTPVALALRLMGVDPMQRKLGTAGTYWLPRKPTPTPASYFRQY